MKLNILSHAVSNVNIINRKALAQEKRKKETEDRRDRFTSFLQQKGNFSISLFLTFNKVFASFLTTSVNFPKFREWFSRNLKQFFTVPRSSILNINENKFLRMYWIVRKVLRFFHVCADTRSLNFALILQMRKPKLQVGKKEQFFV